MKIEYDVSNIPLQKLNNYCIEYELEIEIRHQISYIQIIEVKKL